MEAPEWAETARQEGVRFEATVTDGRTAVELEMGNGSDVPSGAFVLLADARGQAQTQLSEPLAVGDRLSLGLSESGELLAGTDGAPDGARQLDGFVRMFVQNGGFQLFNHVSRL